jgi:two-component system, NarL family, invasion response regulator UvrY
MKNILLVDDHAVMREGIKQILEDELIKVKFGEAGNSAEALDLLSQDPWDAVILDIVLPGRSGLEVLQEIRQQKPDLPVLVYSMHAEEQFAVRALRSGAWGYLSKADVPAHLVKAIRQLLSGRKYLSESVVDKMASALDVHTEKPPHETLSNREFQTMLMIASGKTNAAIAEELSLGISTISTYRARILMKMGMKSNSDIIHYVIEHHLAA